MMTSKMYRLSSSSKTLHCMELRRYWHLLTLTINGNSQTLKKVDKKVYKLKPPSTDFSLDMGTYAIRYTAA